MTDDPKQLHVFPDCLLMRRVDPAQNMQRFYLMTVQRDLFGGAMLVKEWGRIGSAGQVQVSVKVDRLMRKTIQDEEAKESFC
ncbi:WGR domain-containing protein [Tateyamaria sp.]|uniref:WGR domain-containing protein n=1 Tax=Tateyamaria sp. TaxID=1929288 RepID=UPI003B227C53